VFHGLVPRVRLVALSLALAAVSLCQSAPKDLRNVLSNREARNAATYIEEATVPPGLHPTAFTVRISVGADGDVKDVSNPDSLPDALFAAAADAARQWRFPSDRDRGKPRGFEAEITFHGPIAGRVTAKDGTPVVGVVVSGSEWKCCPTQRDSMTTDKSGSFHIEHPGTVLHFLPRDSFQPQSLVVTPQISTLNVILDPAGPSLSLAACGVPQRGFERIGWGKDGLQFDVPQHEVSLVRGKVDVDYVVHIVKAKNGEDRIEFWFGPYAMNSTPDDEQFVGSETFAARNVVMPRGLVRGSEGGVVGSDVWGRLPNGKTWRQMAIVGEGARYRDVSPENAVLFDRIINSACWIPDPKH
jgi:hypothetical protein